MGLSNTDFRDLKAYNRDLGARVEDFVVKSNNAGAHAGSQRLSLVGQQFMLLSPGEAYRLIDPTSFISELESSQGKNTGLLRNAGNVLAALVLLWILFIALLVTNEYQRYLLKFPNDINQAFLTLWLTNFHGTDWPTFGLAVSGEIILLAAYLGVVLWIQRIKRRSERRRNDLAVEIQRLTNDLIEEIARIARFYNPDTARLSRDSVVANEQVNKQFIEETKVIFRNLDTLSQKLLDASNQVNQNTQQLADGTHDLTKSTKDATSSNLSLSNQLQMVEKLQGQSAAEIGNATQIMNDAGQRMAEVAADMQKVVAHVESISQQLTTLSPQDIRLMADQTGTLASTFNRVNATLHATLEELRLAVQANAGASNQTQFQNSFDSTPSQPRPLDPEHLRFTAYYSQVVSLDRPSSLLVYSYIDSALQAVAADFSYYQQQMRSFSQSNTASSFPLNRGTVITIVPRCQGVTFSPRKASFVWVNDVYRSAFQFQANPGDVQAHNGEIVIYAGPIIIGILKISLAFIGSGSQSSDWSNSADATIKPYRKIFVSYSHKDKQVVFACSNAYEGLGHEVFIDSKSLKSGSNWRKDLLEAIEAADIFQLFWSEHSAKSKEVRNEWEHALQHYKYEGFIRPVAWEDPMATPPKEFADRNIHFARMDASLFKIDRPRKPFSFWNIFSFLRQ